MIEGIGITKRYGSATVLSDVSLTIYPGKITSIIGPNGAGKSTLLNILSRLDKTNEGSVLVEGKAIQEWPPNDLAKKLSILKQANQINVRMTIRDLVSFGRFPHSQGRLTQTDWEHVDGSIQHLGLTEIQDKLLDHVSGGQRQRALIAMVVAQDTDCIFLDEPLNSLDMRHSVEMMKTLRKLASSLGKAVVVVLHDINFASCYSDQVVVLKNGRLVSQGSVNEILKEDLIEEVFGLEVRIEEFEGRRICIYY